MIEIAESLQPQHYIVVMIRGNIPFRCADCHKIFIGLDIEWQATARSMPVTCPKCGSTHTLPLLAPKMMYRDIWKKMDENK